MLRQVIHDWNAAHVMSRGTILLPVGWETDTAPLMGGRAQHIINSRIIENADLLVAAFWTRLGTPSGKTDSGTVEEIQAFSGAGKPVMLYFSSAPVQAGSVDAAQFSALQEFRKWCEANGLVGTNDSVLELRDSFTRGLALLVNTHPLFGQRPPANEALPEFIPTPPPVPELSDEAEILLDEVTLDPSATLVFAEYLSGVSIQTNGRDFVP